MSTVNTPEFEAVVSKWINVKNMEINGGMPKPDPNVPEEPDFVDEENVIPDTKANSKFSEAFGFVPPSGIDLPVTVYNKEDWPEHMREFIPEPDDTYVFNQEALEGAILAIEHNEKCNISGPPGSGKTTLIKEIAARTNRPYMRINGKDGVEISSFMGQYVINEGELVWKWGLLPRAVMEGYLLAFDEWTKVPPGIMMSIQWLLEDEGKLLVDDAPGEFHEKLITPHDRFRIILCDNVKGLGDGIDKFASTNVQDTATLNRFGINLTMDYMSPEQEVQMLKNRYPSLTDKVSTRMVAVANQIRSSYKDGNVSLTLSPRNLIKWAKWHLMYRDTGRGFLLSYYNALADESEKSHVEQLYDRVFGKKLIQ